jgi:pimeloyl-ACP methyl ester carboxylesterase
MTHASRVSTSVAALCIALGASFAARPASAQLAYDGTTFLHGFNSNPGAWTSTGTPEILGASVILGAHGYHAPKTDSSATINTQRDQFRTILNSYADREVLIGHSMGGLVARATYIANATYVAGIVTVATPHEGTLLANNTPQIVAWLNDIRTRLGDAMAILGYPGRQRVDDLLLGGFATVQQFAQAKFGIGSPAVTDLRTDSPTISSLDAHTADAVPHANVYGTIAFKNTLFRLANPDETSFQNALHQRNLALSFVKACRDIGYGTIILHSAGRRCSYAYHVLTRIDGHWSRWVNGTNANGTDRYVPFDGVVPNERSVYPGTSNLNFVATNTHHLNITSSPAGRTAIAQAMLGVGMAPKPQFSVSMTGPTQFTGATTLHFASSVANPSGTVTYQWKEKLVNTSTWYTVGTNSATYNKTTTTTTPSFYVSVTVTTTGGQSGSAQKYVVSYNANGCNPPPGQHCTDLVGQ